MSESRFAGYVKIKYCKKDRGYTETLFQKCIQLQKQMFFSSYQEGLERISELENELLAVPVERLKTIPDILGTLFSLERSLLEIAVYHHQPDDTILVHYENMLKFAPYYQAEKLTVITSVLIRDFRHRGNDKLANKLQKRLRSIVKDAKTFYNSFEENA